MIIGSAEYKDVSEALEVLEREGVIGPEHLDAAEVILWGMVGVTGADGIAKASGLNRDRVVRPMVRRLRLNGLWTQDGPVFEEPLEVGFPLSILCAMGLVQKTGDIDAGSV